MKLVRRVFGSGVVVSLAIGLLAVGEGACDRDTLIGIDGTVEIHQPGSGSGGNIASGSGGATVGGSGGTIVSGSGGTIGTSGGPDACVTISTTPGQQNNCGRTQGVAISPDGTLLATVSDVSSWYLRVWRLSDGQLLSQSFAPENVNGAYGVTFSPDGRLIATAGWSASPFTDDNPVSTNTNAVSIWDAATGARIALLPTHSGQYASGLAFSHDGTLLITTGAESFIDVWKVADWTEVRMIPTPTSGSIYAVAFSPDDERFITSGSSGIDQIWNTADGVEVSEIRGLVPEMNRASYSPNGQLIFADAAAGQIQVLDSFAMTLQVMTFSSGASPPYIGTSAWIDDSHFVAGDWSGTVEEWSKDPAQPKGPFSLQQTLQMPGQTLGIAVAPDRHAFVVAGSFGFMFLNP